MRWLNMWLSDVSTSDTDSSSKCLMEWWSNRFVFLVVGLTVVVVPLGIVISDFLGFVWISEFGGLFAVFFSSWYLLLVTENWWRKLCWKVGKPDFVYWISTRLVLQRPKMFFRPQKYWVELTSTRLLKLGLKCFRARTRKNLHE